MRKIKEFFIKNKKHIFFISALLVLMLIFYHSYLSSTRFWIGELNSASYDQLYFSTKALEEYKQFPLWLPNYQAGMPFFAHPNHGLFFYTTIIGLIMPTTEVALNFSLLFNMFLGGLFMYLLMIYFKHEPKIAFVSALIYMFSIAQVHVFTSYMFRSGVVGLAPLIYLLVWKALNDKKWIKYSVIAGLVLALQFHSNGVDWFLFMILVFMSIFITYLISKNIKKRIIKEVIVGLIICLVFFGLIAIKIFPLLEYGQVSSKEEGFSFDDSVGNKIDIKSFSDFVKYFLIVPDARGFHKYSTEIGIAAFVLLFFSFFEWRKRYVLGFIILALIAILVGTGSPFFYLMWKFIPGISRMHHVERVGYIFVLACAPLAGIGLNTLLNKLKGKIGERKSKLVYLAVLGLVFVDMFVFTFHVMDISDDNKFNFRKMVDNNDMMQYISKDKDIFRIDNIKTDRHSGYASGYALLLDEEILYGGSSLWFPELYTFLGMAHSYPAKFYGMLNTKYLYSNEPINQSYIKFINKFDECDICYEHEPVDHGVDGPYLFYNELYLPRAYLADYGILVIGDKEAVDQTTYSLMIQNSFNPSNSVIIIAYGRINDYDINFLKRFNAIVLTQNSIDQSSGFILQQYVNNGGKLLPDVVNGKNSISQEDIDNLFSSFKGDYKNVKKIEITKYTPNKRIMQLKGEKGWMVLAEKFFMFEGWDPKFNNAKKTIYRANGMNSAVYLEGESGELLFKYSPKSFRKGAIISGSTLMLIIVFFIVSCLKHRKKNV